MNPSIEADNYLRVAGFIESARAARLAQEFRELVNAGRYTLDEQAPNSPAIYNFLPFVRLMVEKVGYVSELCGEPVLPTYTYARIYGHGERLPRHRDRDACEISWTLNLAQDSDWPIFIRKPDGDVAGVSLSPGDAMMYLGCEADHWRDRFEGREFVQLFIHYVRAYGPRAYAFFDKERTRPGERPAMPAAAGGPKPVVTDAQALRRNEPCPCGSGLKYKHCHGKAG
jgi:SEC-C motif